MRYLLSSLNMKQSICYFIAIVIKYSDNDSDSMLYSQLGPEQALIG